jgi:hypothetical protein
MIFFKKGSRKTKYWFNNPEVFHGTHVELHEFFVTLLELIFHIVAVGE